MIRTSNSRRGTVLLLVLVIVPVLALVGYAYNHAMRAESTASLITVKQAQAKMLAESGLQATLSILSNPDIFDPDKGIDIFNEPSMFAAQEAAPNGGMFSIIHVDEENNVRFGVSSECAKIPLTGGKVQLTRDMLLKLPNMTEQIADRILDYIDPDDTALQYGAESSYYSLLTPPYSPRNAAPLCVDELLLVPGVTPALLYGNDANLDGIMSNNENDGDENWPSDTGAGALDRGWYHYFTVHSKGDNRKPDGTNKTNLNGEVKTGATALTEAFELKVAAYYAIYKQANQNLKAVSDLIETTADLPASQLQQAFTAAGLDPMEAASSLGIQLPQNNQPGGNNQPGVMTPTVTVTGDSMVVGLAPQRGGRNTPNQDSQDPPVTIQSPWKGDLDSATLDKLLQEFAIDDATSVDGVIDVQNAPLEVLLCLPGVTEEIANKILSSAQGKTGIQPSIGWLLSEKLLTAEQFRAVEPMVTANPRTFRVESVGFFGGSGPIARLEAVVQLGELIPEVLVRRDLVPLGNGYNRDMLTNGGTTP